MIELGILGAEERVELLEGWIVEKMTRNPPHDAILNLINNDILRPLLQGRDWHCRVQAAVTTDESEPEPDLAVVRGRARDYLTRHPSPSDVGLVIEVADSSLRNDVTLKASVYARGSIPTYWVVNLPDRRLEVLTDPTGPAPVPSYRSQTILGPDDEAVVVLGGVEVGRVSVREILP